MKRLLFLIMFLPFVFGMDTSQVSFMQVSCTYSGTVSDGNLLLHVPPADGIQSYSQVTANDLSEDSIGIYMNTSGSFAYSADITVNASKIQIKSDPTLPIPGYEEFEEPTAFIDSDNAAIIQKALEIAGTENKELEVIAKVIQWNYENIEYDSSSVSLPKRKASDVLTDGVGVCGDISVSTAAMLRSLGVPVKYVAGYLVLTEDSYQAHAWLEVYVPGTGWVPIDPTNGQFMITANHIKLYSSADPSDLGDTLFYSGGDAVYDKGNVSIKVTNSQSFPEMLTPYALVEQENISVGSVFDMMLYLKNDNSFYVVPDITLSASKGLSANSVHKMMVIAPFLEKAAQFSFTVSDNLDSGYIYTFFIVTEGPGFSLTKNVTVEGISTGTVMKFSLDDVSAEQQGTSIVISVAVKNYGSEPLTNAKVTSTNPLFRDQLKYLSVLPEETKEVTFTYPTMLNASDYSFEISVTSGDYRVSKIVPFTVQSEGSSGLEYINLLIVVLIIIVSAANVIIYWPALDKRYFKGVKSKQKIQKQDSDRKYDKHLDKHKINESMDFLSHLDKQKVIDDERHTIDELKSRRHKKR